MAVDNLYILRDNKNTSMKDILVFIDSNTLQIQKTTRRKIRVFGINPKDLDTKEVRDALDQRNIKSFPALVVNISPRGGPVVHGADSIKLFYNKLVRSYKLIEDTNRRRGHIYEDDHEYGDPGFTSMMRGEINSDTQDTGGVADDDGPPMVRGGGPSVRMGDEDDDEEQFDMATYRSRLAQRKNSVPPPPPTRGGSIPSVSLNAPSQASTVGADKKNDVMASVHKSCKQGGKDADLEMKLFQNMLEETDY